MPDRTQEVDSQLTLVATDDPVASLAAGTDRADCGRHDESRDDPFIDEYEFLDDIHGSIRMNRLERDVIDTPEFQRLFRLGQLGFVDLVYPTANHTRGTHSIGACFWSKKLVDTLIHNCSDTLHVSKAERVLIGLGGLLHDIPHGPFSHDIEKKTHHIYPDGPKSPKKKVESHYGPYEKHDNWTANPALYVFFNDSERSVLARVLRGYSPTFARLLVQDVGSHLRPFIDLLNRGVWPGFETELLPQLLFHLLVHEKEEESTESLSLRTSFDNIEVSKWGLGPTASWKDLHDTWYQPFRHDVIGDTLSADLIDYLMRDQARLGMKNQLDLKLLNHYILVRSTVPTQGNLQPQKYRCAIDLNDRKRGTFRAERLNDLFRLLDIRHQIHEKAVYHRVVQSAIAMLSRAMLMMKENKPPLSALYGFGATTPALAGDVGFLDKIARNSKDKQPHQSLPCKLAERRVYRPLMVIPGDRIRLLLQGEGNFDASLEHPLRELAAIIDSHHLSSFFLLLSVVIEKLLAHAIDSEKDLNAFLAKLAENHERLRSVTKVIPKRVIFWTTPYKQLYKDPAILVCAGDVTATVTKTIEELQEEPKISDSLKARIKAGIKDAETKNEGLWKFYVFLSDGLFYTGALAKIRQNHPCNKSAENHKLHLETAQNIVVRALRFAWRYWQGKQRQIDLTKPVKIETLAQLLTQFVADDGWSALGVTNISKDVSAVKIDQYLHGDDSPRCRDVRYKFDAPRKLEELLTRSIAKKEERAIVRQAIQATGLDTAEVKGEEMAEVVCRFASAASKLPELLKDAAARNGLIDEDRLKDLWLDDLK